MDFFFTVLIKNFYIHWSAGRSPRVHEVNPGRGPSFELLNYGWIVGYIYIVMSIGL